MANTTASAISSNLPQRSVPVELASTLPGARLLGAAPFKFFGLLVYDIHVWGMPEFDMNQYDNHPFALELVYARKLDGSAIAERSIAEMRRVGPFDELRERSWKKLMDAAFPDVQGADRITGLHDGKGGVRFWHNGRPTASVQDKDYARLFFGIWLSPKTSAPALRQSLLGQTHAQR